MISLFSVPFCLSFTTQTSHSDLLMNRQEENHVADDDEDDDDEDGDGTAPSGAGSEKTSLTALLLANVCVFFPFIVFDVLMSTSSSFPFPLSSTLPFNDDSQMHLTAPTKMKKKMTMKRTTETSTRKTKTMMGPIRTPPNRLRAMAKNAQLVNSMMNLARAKRLGRRKLRPRTRV